MLFLLRLISKIFISSSGTCKAQELRVKKQVKTVNFVLFFTIASCFRYNVVLSHCLRPSAKRQTSPHNLTKRPLWPINEQILLARASPCQRKNLKRLTSANVLSPAKNLSPPKGRPIRKN